MDRLTINGERNLDRWLRLNGSTILNGLVEGHSHSFPETESGISTPLRTKPLWD